MAEFSDILRPDQQKRHSRKQKTVISMMGRDEYTSNNNVQESIRIPKERKRLPRADAVVQETESDKVEKIRNDPAYHPGHYKQKGTKHESHFGVKVREKHKDKLNMRNAMSVSMVTWRDPNATNLSAKITDPADLAGKENNTLEDVEHLKIEDENHLMKDLPSSICNLKHVIHLDVKYARIRALPPWMTKMEQVTVLTIKETLLFNIDVICKMTQLSELDLSINRLAAVPKQIENLVNLVDFKLTGNAIASLPGEINRLKKLEKLDMSSNKLKTLPDEICDLKKLHSLDISRNMLESLPDTFGSLDKLTFLALSNNRLTVFPPSFKTLKSLKYLILASNKISILPEELEHLVTLEHLNVRNNEIVRIDGFPASVKIALMDTNGLTDVDIIGEKSQKLEVLSIKANDIKHIPQSLMPSSKLKALYVDDNPVENVPDEIANIEQLRHLTLNKTKLRKLPGGNGSRNRLSLLDVQETNLSDDVIKSATKGIDSHVVANNIKRANRNSGAIKGGEED